MTCARLLAFAVVVLASPPARADEPAAEPTLVTIPTDCFQFWSGSAGPYAPRAWDSMLSFAACIQDGSVEPVERADQLPRHIEKLHAGLAFSLHLYQVAIDSGPPSVRLRAVYYVGLGQIALITRVRASTSTRGPELEKLLEPHARLAFFMFATIDRVAEQDPSLATDVVERFMVRSARELAASLSKGWSFTAEDALLAQH